MFSLLICLHSYRRGIPSHQGKQRNITSHPSYNILFLVLLSGLLLGCTLHGRVVNGHTVLICTRSSALSCRSTTQPGIPLDTICKCRILLASFPIEAWRIHMSLYVQKKQVTGEVPLAPGAVIREWLVSLKDFGCKDIPGRCRKCPVSIDLYAK